MANLGSLSIPRTRGWISASNPMTRSYWLLEAKARAASKLVNYQGIFPLPFPINSPLERTRTRQSGCSSWKTQVSLASICSNNSSSGCHCGGVDSIKYRTNPLNLISLFNVWHHFLNTASPAVKNPAEERLQTRIIPSILSASEARDFWLSWDVDLAHQGRLQFGRADSERSERRSARRGDFEPLITWPLPVDFQPTEILVDKIPGAHTDIRCVFKIFLCVPTQNAWWYS